MQRSLAVGAMMEHDPRCEVAKYGWHVLKIFAKEDTPGWAFSIGLYKNFNHPEIVVFGLNDDLMHSVINSIGEDVRVGKHFVMMGSTRISSKRIRVPSSL